MNLLKLFKSLVTLLGIIKKGWFPITVNQDTINGNSVYSDKYHDISNENSYGYWIPIYFNCDKIRLKCNSNVSFKATTFHNYSSPSCPTDYEHNIVLPYYLYNNKFAITQYLTEGSLWNISIKGYDIFSVVNCTEYDYFKYFFNEDYLREIILKNGFTITNNYINEWIVPKNGTYTIIVSKMRDHYDNRIEMHYKYNSTSQCIAPNSNEIIQCNNGKISNSIVYRNNTDGILIYSDENPDKLHSEVFECILED